MKFSSLLFAFLVAAGTVNAQSGLDLLGHKINAPILPADSVVLGDIGRLDPATNEIEWLAEITAGDMPYDLPTGTYVLGRRSGIEETIVLSADSPVAHLVANYRPGPFGVFSRTGQLYRTDGFALRSSDEMLALLQARWPYFATNKVVPVSASGVTAEQKAASLESFRLSLDSHFGTVMELLDGQNLMDLAFETRLEIAGVSDHLLATALAGLAAVGTQDDVGLLYERAEILAERGVIFTWPSFVETAVLIESRANILGTGQTVALFDRYMEGVDSPIYPLVVNELAAFGHRPALSYLVQALPAGELPQLWDGWDRARAFSTLVRFESPELYDYALRVIDTYRAEQIRILEGQPWQASALQIELTRAIELALFYAATRASTNENALSFPIQQTNTYMMSLAPALEDPSELVGYFLSTEDGFRLDQLADMVCPSVYGRSSDPELLDRLYGQFRDLAIRGGHIRPDWVAQSAVSIGLSNCLVSPQSLRYVESPIKQDVSLTHPLPWRYGLSDISTTTDATLNNAVPHVDHLVLDAAPDRWVNEVLAQKTATPAVAEYLRYREVATTAGNFVTSPYTGNLMLRMFMQPFRDQAEQERQLWAQGEVGLRVQADTAKDIVYFGLSVQAAGHAENALAATIAREPEIIAANVNNGGFGMIEKVVFRNIDGPIELEFSGTMSSGIHAYLMNGIDTELSDAVVDVHFAPKDLDGKHMNRWVVSFPLHVSPFAFESRVHNGRVTFQ